MDAYSARLGAVVDHRRAQLALRAAAQKAEAHSRAKSEFIASMSHELRTPLNAVIGFAGLLHDDTGRLSLEKRREYANDIVTAGRHLLGLVNDVLDFSTLQSSTLRVDAEPICVAEIVQACATMLREQAAKKGVALDVRVVAPCRELRTDAQRVRQIALNLISNAIKFTPRDGRVTAICAPVSPAAVALQIRDTGVGMSPAQLDIALSPFGQVENVFTRSEGGSGIGLPLSRALCELLGASFAIESEPDVGTTVTMVFRDHPGDAHAEETRS